MPPSPLPTHLHAFIAGLPKTEHHVHIEGTLTAALRLRLSAKHGIPLPAGVRAEADLRALYRFHDLPSFLEIYYQGMECLRDEEDFFALGMGYFEVAARENIRLAELFFDPQAHTSRGIPLPTVLAGLTRAQSTALTTLSIRSSLIACILRDLGGAAAMTTLESLLPYRAAILGLGLDSDEAGHPPAEFAAVFARARDEGFRLTMHCDVDQVDAAAHVREAVESVGVERVDHGVNAADAPGLAGVLAARGVGLTFCPVSTRLCAGRVYVEKIAALRDAGVKVCLNSDDPAYMGAYLGGNFGVMAEEMGLSAEEEGEEGEERAVGVLSGFVQDGIEMAWVEEGVKEGLRREVRKYVQGWLEGRRRERERGDGAG